MMVYNFGLSLITFIFVSNLCLGVFSNGVFCAFPYITALLLLVNEI